MKTKITYTIVIAIFIGLGFVTATLLTDAKQKEFEKTILKSNDKIKELEVELNEYKKSEKQDSKNYKITKDMILRYFVDETRKNDNISTYTINNAKIDLSKGIINISIDDNFTARMNGQVGGAWYFKLDNNKLIVTRTVSAGYVTKISSFDITTNSITSIYESDFDLAQFQNVE